MRRLQFLRRGGREGGYTLIELLVVLVILTTVVTALTALYVSGANAEVQASRRSEAQQEARMAVERLRREVHCASAITPAGTAVASVTVTLPAACPSPDTSVVWSTELVSSGRYRLKRGSVVVADYLTSANVFTYTAPSAAALGKLHVNFPVNIDPSGGSPTWTLVDDIVLRNTTRA